VAFILAARIAAKAEGGEILGNVRTETLRAYTRAEIGKIIGGLP
jgi:uncharacterized protein with GYD domain